MYCTPEPALDCEECIVSRTKRTPLVPPLGGTRFRWWLCAAANAPAADVVKLTPSGDVAIENWPSEAVSSSPQTAPGSIAKSMMSTGIGNRTVADFAPPATSVLQPVENDWSNAAPGPHP